MTRIVISHFIPFLLQQNKALLSQQIIKLVQINSKHYANRLAISHTGKSEKHKRFFPPLCNNYCKTQENPWGTALCQWLKRLMTVLKAAHRDKSKI